MTLFSSTALKLALALIYPKYCFFAAFCVWTVQRRWQWYNVVTKRGVCRKYFDTTSKGGGMDSL